MVGDQLSGEGGSVQENGFAVLHQGIRGFGGGPTDVGITVPGGGGDLAYDGRHGVNAGGGNGVAVVGGVEVTGHDGVPVADQQLAGGGVGGHQRQETAEQPGMRGFVEGNVDAIGTGAGGKGGLGLACAREIGVTHFHGDLVGNRIHGVVEVDCANPIGARREEVEDVAQENDIRVGRAAGGGHRIQREGEEDDAARTVHANVRITHPARFAGHRLERDRRGIGRRRERVGEIRPEDIAKTIVETGVAAVIQCHVHTAGDGCRRAENRRHAKILVAGWIGCRRIRILYEPGHLKNIPPERRVAQLRQDTHRGHKERAAAVQVSLNHELLLSIQRIVGGRGVGQAIGVNSVVHLVIGYPPDDHRERLQVGELRITPRVHFPKSVTDTR